MAWRDRHQKGSFRGVEFEIDGGDASFGRRNVPHEYPLRDKPYVEDLGRKTRRFRIDAVLVGEDYMDRRDALIAAIEQPGPGKLVHPHYGEMQVSVEDFAVQESSAQGGMARLVIAVVEAGEFTFPSAQPDTRRQVEQRSQQLQAAGAEGFGSRFSIGGLPAFAVASPSALVGQLLGQVRSLGDLPLASALQRAALGVLVGGLQGQLGGLLAQPLSLATAVFGLFGQLRATMPTAATGATAFQRLATFGHGLPGIVATTPTRQREAANQGLLIELVRVAAVAEAARAVAGVQFESFEQAQELRDGLVDAVDAIAEATSHDPSYDALMDLRAILVRDINTRGADLARSVQYVPPATVPAIVVAYGLYEDVAREADLLLRNRVPHPGFVPAGQALEVLADG